ncbi:hypothetical protein A0H81_04992 [Grifola frondosa]|uniref:Uncharacterized protein n=1 Tax=Grifola frondosa TaxID=5627 RepID=A0A1C7MG22_GRIFR|nr:hypothetical protein A0H81_04992 [Grifola frondosa]
MAADYAVRAQVEARLASARIGTVMQSVTLSMLGNTFTSAPLQSPPIATGMTETMKKLKEIVLKRGAVSQAEFTQVPGLLRRLRHLLRIYYDAKLSGRKPVEFKFCDAADLSDVGLDLHEMGIYLQLSPARLRALLRSAPDIEKFLIDEPLDIGKWRLDAQRATDAVNADPESDDDDRMGLIDLEDTSSDDLAAYQMVYFIADLLVAFLVMWRTALGDSLTDAMRPIYWNQDVMVHFAHAGGLPALFGDWAQSVAKDGACKKAIETLPSRAWECQTETSLQGVLSALISKVEVDGDDVAATPVYARILHEMYSRYGLGPFEKGSTLSSDTILIYFLYRRISCKPGTYTTPGAFLTLLKKYKNVPRATRRRHGWMILSISGR